MKYIKTQKPENKVLWSFSDQSDQSEPFKSKENTNLWDLLIWAYIREYVRFSSSGSFALGYGGGSMTGVVCDRLRIGKIDPVGVIGRPAAHDDAVEVDCVVSMLEPADYWRVVRAAERQSVPDWCEDLPKGRLVPERRANGNPVMIRCPVSHRAVACKLQLIGYSTSERERIITAARAEYSRWYNLLVFIEAKIRSRGLLTRWAVSEIGVKGKPWEVRQQNVN